MAAIATTLLSFLSPGDVIVHSDPVYGGTEFLVHNILPRFGIQRIGFLAGSDPDAVERAAKEGQGLGRVGVIFVETPANPTNGRWW